MEFPKEVLARAEEVRSKMTSSLNQGDVVIFKNQPELKYVVMDLFFPMDAAEDENPADFVATVELQSFEPNYSVLNPNEIDYSETEAGENQLTKIGSVSIDELKKRYEKYYNNI